MAAGVERYLVLGADGELRFPPVTAIADGVLVTVATLDSGGSGSDAGS